MNPSEIQEDRCYTNSFGTTYRAYKIEDGDVLYRIEGIRMSLIRMKAEEFARHVEPEEQIR